jgi:hypothetical protein
LIKDARDGGHGLYYDHSSKQFMFNKMSINKEYVQIMLSFDQGDYMRSGFLFGDTLTKYADPYNNGLIQS